MKKEFKSAEEKEAFVTDILELLWDKYYIGSAIVYGNSISCIQDYLRGKWKGISNYNDLVDTLKDIGFSVDSGRGVRGNRKAMVVYI